MGTLPRSRRQGSPRLLSLIRTRMRRAPRRLPYYPSMRAQPCSMGRQRYSENPIAQFGRRRWNEGDQRRVEPLTLTFRSYSLIFSLYSCAASTFAGLARKCQRPSDFCPAPVRSGRLHRHPARPMSSSRRHLHLVPLPTPHPALHPTEPLSYSPARIRIIQQALHARQDCRDVISRAPSILQDIEAELSVVIDVWVEHLAHEPDRGGFIGVGVGEG